jgi:hypothetical protein
MSRIVVSLRLARMKALPGCCARGPQIFLARGLEMKTVNLLIPLVASLVAPWVQADAIVKTPRTAASATAGQLSTNVQHALARFIAGCSAHDAQILDSVTTEDVRIEYSLDAPGRYLTLDAISLADDCGIDVASGGSSLRAMWIYPTNDQSVAFVQFDVTSDSSGALKRQLALVEMRGEKIARLLSFSPPSNALVTVTGAASPSLTRRAAARQATGSE